MSLDPMGEGAPPPLTMYRPRESERGHYTEKKFGEEMLGTWERTPLPDDAVVRHVTLIPYRGERAVVAWQQGRQLLPEGDVQPGEDAEAAVRRIALEQTGIQDPKVSHLGHFRCRATIYSTTDAPGTITYRALYAIETGSLADFPSDTAFERRIILQRDLNTILRGTYVEMRREYTDALDDWLLERLKANLRSE